MKVFLGINDVYDLDIDVRNPRKVVDGLLRGIILQPVYHTAVKRAAFASAVLILAVSFTTKCTSTMLATAIFLTLGYQYSSPPFRIKKIPVADSLSNGIIVWLCIFIGCSSGGGSLAAMTKGYILGLAAVAAHCLGAAVDLDADVGAGQTTIATFLG